MKLYKDSGTNPFASCLPILLQMPIFFALFGVLNNAADGNAKGVARPRLTPRPSVTPSSGVSRCPGRSSTPAVTWASW